MAVQRRSLKDQVKQQLLERILRGRYAPGERLREVALAKELNTSPIPVREALRELVSLRVVESEAYKGVRVRQFTPNELKEAYELRAVLECYAAEKGARNLKGKTEPLRKRYLAMLAAARAGDIETYAQNDIPFHRLIVEAAENAFLLRAWEGLGFEIRTRIFLASKELDMVQIAKLHQPIIEAFENGDAKRAAKLLRDHSLGFAAEIESQDNQIERVTSSRKRRSKRETVRSTENRSTPRSNRNRKPGY
jgi:DNA-binding GntR family transcriptional regulator